MQPRTEFRLLHFIKKLPVRFKALFYFGLAVYACQYVFIFLIPLAQKNFIDNALATKHIWSPEAWRLMWLMFAASLTLLAEYVCFRKLQVRLRDYLYRQAVGRVLKLPKHIIQTHGSAYYTSIFTNLTQSLSTLVSPSVFDFSFGFVQMLCVNYLIYSWCRPVFYLFMGAYALTALNTYIFHRQRGRLADMISASNARLSADSNDIVLNTFTLKTSANPEHFTAPLWETLRESNEVQNSVSRALETNRFWFSAIKYAALFFMLVIVLSRIINSMMTYGQLLAIIAYFQSLFAPFYNYVTFLGNMTNYGSWVKRYEDSLPELYDGSPEAEVTLPRGIESVELRDIRLPYGKSDQPLSFKIDGRIGITGISGEGKSSILKMLYREVMPEKGGVIINDSISYRLLSPGFYFSAFNIIPQNIEIFNRALYDNILLGRTLLPDKEKDSALGDIRKALSGVKPGSIRSTLDLDPLLRPLAYSCGMDADGVGNCSQFLSFVEKPETLTRAFNSYYVLKSEFEDVLHALNLKKLAGRRFGAGGEHLSGGEKQRIAFARFLLRKDYEFYILDEPLVSVDALHKSLLVKLIVKSISAKRGILISHDFRMLETLSSKVMLVKDGAIEEAGTIQELIAKGGHYSELRSAYYSNTANLRNSESA